jgi:flagellar biosynthetic protein FliR
MQSILNDLLVGNAFALLLIFMRFGTALMVMPGIGDAFTPMQTRLLFALALSFVMLPVLSVTGSVPPMPGSTAAMVGLLLSEAFIGIFLGTVMRILVSALDTAGSVISMQSGFSNAMIFNPVTATQGSLVGGLYSMLGVVLLLSTNMYHFMLASVVESYQAFPVESALPSMQDFSDAIVQSVSVAFKIGIQLSLPFIVVGLLMQIGFGLLGRLMPQIQVFFLALPLQIWLSLIILALALSTGMLYWLGSYEEMIASSLGGR